MSRCFTGLLTMMGTVLLFTGATAQAQHGSAEPHPSDAKEIHDYTLTMDKVREMAAASTALTELGKHHPEMDDLDDAKTIPEMVRRINKYPDAVAAIRAAGLTPHEYVVCFLTVVQSSLAVGFKRSGTYKDYPPQILQQVSKTNLDFTEQHWNEIQQITNGSD